MVRSSVLGYAMSCYNNKNSLVKTLMIIIIIILLVVAHFVLLKFAACNIWSNVIKVYWFVTVMDVEISQFKNRNLEVYVFVN